jgi:hypothetical protein
MHLKETGAKVWTGLSTGYSPAAAFCGRRNEHCCKVVPVNVYGGSGCIDPYFLDLGISRRWAVSYTPQPLYPRGKKPWYPLQRRLGGPQSRYGQHGEEKILDPTGTWTPTPWPSSLQPVAIPTYAIPAPWCSIKEAKSFHKLKCDGISERNHAEQENVYRMCFVENETSKAYTYRSVSVHYNKNEKYSKSILFPPIYVLVTQVASLH